MRSPETFGPSSAKKTGGRLPHIANMPSVPVAGTENLLSTLFLCGCPGSHPPQPVPPHLQYKVAATGVQVQAQLEERTRGLDAWWVDCVGVSGVHVENGKEGGGLLCPLLTGMGVFCASKP